MGKRLRSRLDLIYPDVSNQVKGKQWKQKCYNDKKQATQTFVNRDLVYSEDFSSAPEKWIPGISEKVTGRVSYQILLENSQILRHHVDSVRVRFPAQANPVPLQDIPVQDTSVPDSLEEDTYVFSPSTNNELVNSKTTSSGRNSESTARAPAAALEHTSSQRESTVCQDSNSTNSPVRRSSCPVVPPDRLTF